jgi:hypothetical protein
MLYVETSFMQMLTVTQLRALTTDAKVETYRALCGSGVPSEEGRFLEASPQEQAERLFLLMHPGEPTSVSDRLTTYLDLRECLSTTKRALQAIITNLKAYPDIETAELEQFQKIACDMATGMDEFHRSVALVCYR